MLSYLIAIEAKVSILKRKFADWLVGGEPSSINRRYQVLEDYCIELSRSYSNLAEVSLYLQAYYDSKQAYDESGYSQAVNEAVWWADDWLEEDNDDIDYEFDDCEQMEKVHDL